ncbi:glycosyltransferase family 4 protein [Rhodocytophaga aerolata]|uniref:Glycosyltransferase family 4 protein n=1 Tax=Rhodocytophaga aerolata TaxID=455078 RepID=A0ABT8R205_9BACT|nr:glycosyltransferase family 4 protein [Rhodocytophaga aerolata]MDO1446129.1 glycosyltransferase family 4 protein [Rhodocytophaga aerolata]
MNIAFLCTSASWGGLEMNMIRLAHRMQDRGHTILVLTHAGTPYHNKAQEYHFSCEILEVKYPYLSLAAAKQLAVKLTQHQIQFIFFSLAKDNYVCSYAKFFFKKELKLLYLQQMEVGINKKGLLQTFIYRQLNAWITPLHLLAKQVLARTYMAPEKIKVIPLGTDTERFAGYLGTKEEARKQLGLPADAFVAGILGRIDPDKGQEYLIKALPLLLKKNKEIHVVIVGEESRGDTRKYPQYLQNLVQELNVGKFVHFRPFTEQTEVAFAALNIFVMASSLGETYGMVTVEAMASGIPVIGTNSGGTPELLDFGKAGLLVPPKDPDALAAAIEKLMTDKLLWEELRTTASQRALTKYSYQLQCDLLEQLLKTTDKE